MTAKLLQFPVRIHAHPEPATDPTPVTATAELNSLLCVLLADARWCEQASNLPHLSNRDCGRLRKLARHLRREIAALTPKPGRS